VVQLIRSGRRSRAIYPARVLEEAPDMVRARAEAGEQVRILASLPSRVAILGTSAALIPQRWGESPGPRLVVRQHAVIGALRELFERLWERGMAVPGLDGQRGSDASRDRRLLLDQLARGAKDEQVARALGLSLRTVRRRVAEILEELGVDSRFQAGVEAVRRGWI
jgi:ATP/maltotriose-dependent transcriptional regulator MalT